METHFQDPTSGLFVAAPAHPAARVPQDGELLGRSTAPVWLFVGISAICVLAMLAAGIAGARDCRALPIRVVHGEASDLSAMVPANGSCVFMVQPAGATIDELRIESAPAQGRLETRGRTAVVYRPQRDFKGEDRFELSLVAGGGRGTATIRMQLMVR
jgi:hypothetical protein